MSSYHPYFESEQNQTQDQIVIDDLLLHLKPSDVLLFKHFAFNITCASMSTLADPRTSVSTNDSSDVSAHTVARELSTSEKDAFNTSQESFPSTSTSSAISSSLPAFSGCHSRPQHSLETVDPVCTPTAKTQSLIRRISQGAQSRLRNRPSITTHNTRLRDQTAGPVLLRRPSDLTSVNDAASQLSELELEPCSEDGEEDDYERMSSSIMSQESNSALAMTALGANQLAALPAQFEYGVAPTISTVLEKGTWVLKVTKNSRRHVKLRLDPSAARVCWNSSKQKTKIAAKNQPNKQFYIDDIQEIRIAAEARNSRPEFQISPEQEECWMTVIYVLSKGPKARAIKTLNFVAPNTFVLNLWTAALRAVERDRIETMNALSANHDKSARSMQLAWTHVMSTREEGTKQRLNTEDARLICRKLEINCAPQTIATYFDLANTDHRESLDYAQYEQFIDLFKIRHDIRRIYDAIKLPNESMLDLESFLAFLRDCQGINIDEDPAYWSAKFNSVARKYNHCESLESSPTGLDMMSAASFQKFLTSNTNAVLPTADSNVTFDRPLNEYFISSSHNTYLLGRQVAGASTVEGYISALVRGCRCIEIDCWDGRNRRPVVNHGRTLSSDVLFEDCIHVINKYAFTSSPYPLIISLEVHCNPEQQACMVEIMTRIFGETVLLAPLNDKAVLPSPEELRHRILIKVKATQSFDDPAGTEDVLATYRSRSQSSPYRPRFPISPAIPSCAVMTAPSSPALKPLTTTSFNVHADIDSPGPSCSASDSEMPMTPSETGKKIKTSNITPVLSALGVYIRGMKFSNFASPGAKMYNHIFSLTENAFASLCREELRRSLEMHNQQFMMRVYPARLRLDSSNFNPLQCWRHGVQMAALNWQTNDVNMQVNSAMFDAGNDRAGYVLKPLELRQPILVDDLLSPSSIVRPGKGVNFVKMSVEIISAQRLPRPHIQIMETGMNPYIRFELVTAEDRARGIIRTQTNGWETPSRDVNGAALGLLCTRTRVVEGNGFNPIFDYKTIASVETKHPELLFARWTVWNSVDGKTTSSNDVMLATFTAKVRHLRQGYRHLPLYNAFGERYREAMLFVNLQVEAPIPINVEENKYMPEDATSPRVESSKSERFWPRKLFRRSSTARRGRSSATSGDVSRGSSTRQSSVERHAC